MITDFLSDLGTVALIVRHNDGRLAILDVNSSGHIGNSFKSYKAIDIYGQEASPSQKDDELTTKITSM